MNLLEILEEAKTQLREIVGDTVDLFSIKIPDNPEDVIPMVIISKISPLVANIFEISITRMLNECDVDWGGRWKRQDPDFPDIILEREIEPLPGIEIKTWFPFSTELTARYRESQLHLQDNNNLFAILCWIPEYILFGMPKIIGVFVGEALEIAQVRDNHYYNPPDYLLIEPGDTSKRTRNLQQRNVSGYKFQDSKRKKTEAQKLVDSWDDFTQYSLDEDKQEKIRSLYYKYNYRNETNFSKLDRIQHAEIEDFISEMKEYKLYELELGAWKQQYLRDKSSMINKLLDIAHGHL